jgi:hypothetical protein
MVQLSPHALDMVKDPSSISAYSLQTLAILRDPHQFQWHAITLLLLVLYVYQVQISKKNWNVVLGGLALWGCDWFNEIWNGLVFYFTQYAPVWGTPGNDSSFVILIGLNIEITFMFAVMGVVATLALPEDKKMKIFGIPNRLLIAIGFTTAAVIVEMILNTMGALTWEYAWWSTKAPWLLWIFGYFYFFAVAFWVHDMEKIRSKLIAVGTILGIDAACLIVFSGILGWI